MISRRGLLTSILAAGMAPAAIGSNILMPVKKIYTGKEILTDTADTAESIVEVCLVAADVDSLIMMRMDDILRLKIPQNQIVRLPFARQELLRKEYALSTEKKYVPPAPEPHSLDLSQPVTKHYFPTF